MLSGNLKSLHSLWVNLATNHRYSDYIDKRDIQTFTDRLEHEGLSFLTSVLPNIGKAVDKFHATTVWNPPVQFGLTSNPNRRTLPIFMGKAVRCALEGDSLAVDCVRQLSLMFYKLEVKYAEEIREQFLDHFVNTDRDLADPVSSADVFTAELIREMRLIIGKVLCNENPYDIRPSHGTGATACRTANWDKYHKLRYYKKLDDTYSYSDHFFYSPSHLIDELDKLEESALLVPQARVVLVPKDSRGPRIISCEPAELMYIQQGLMRKLYKILETSPYTSGQLNFTDQSINQNLARSSSITDDLCTLDLRDASDRVSLSLVRAVFPPNWVECFEACRSETTILPDGRVVKLNKFAPMGSSCCFPVEALVFWACCKASITLSSGLFRPEVYVYGDDIITSSLFYDDVVRGLEAVGLTVNHDKSYRCGPFRESCGGDYHLGVNVTPVRVRQIPSILGTCLATTADLFNELLNKFGEETLTWITDMESELGYIYPRTQLDIPCSLRTQRDSSRDVFFRRRWNKYLQRYEHRVLTLISKVLTKHPPNWAELLRKELCRDLPTAGEYANPLSVADRALDPGQYTVVHAVRHSWTWVWLG